MPSPPFSTSSAPMPARLSASRWVASTLGIILLLAAALKAIGLAFDPVPQVSFFGGRRFQLAVVLAEVILGLWLVSGWWQVASWWLSVIVFTVFAAFSGSFAAIGQSSCGCFGSMLSVPPLATFVFDIMALASLLRWQPPGVMDFRKLGISWRNLAWTIGGTAAIGLGLAVCLVGYYGSMNRAWAAFFQEPCSLVPTVLDIGAAPKGTVREIAFQFMNHSDEPVQILGGASSCSCVTMASSALVVPPRESRTIPVQIVFIGSEGDFVRLVLVYYGHANVQREAFAKIVGRVASEP